MNKNILNTIEQVSNSFPSLFSREDVIKLLTDLNAELEAEAPKSKFDRDALAVAFREVLSNISFREAVNDDDIELSIGWDKKIEIDSIHIDEDFIINEAVDALDSCLDNLEAEENN